MYQVSFNFLLYFRRYAPDKLFIAKLKKGSNSVNTGDRVMVLAFCNFPYSPLPVSSFIYLFSKLLEICSGQKFDGRTDKAVTICSPFGQHKNENRRLDILNLFIVSSCIHVA